MDKKDANKIVAAILTAGKYGKMDGFGHREYVSAFRDMLAELEKKSPEEEAAHRAKLGGVSI